jgi:hypothetical protein
LYSSYEFQIFEVRKGWKCSDVTIYKINIIFEDIPQDHELFNLGTKLTTENPLMQQDIARIIKVADAKGREHECILKISIDRICEDMSEWDLGKIFFITIIDSFSKK